MAMREAVEAYPLSWPQGWKRTPAEARDRARFGKREQRAGESWTRLQEVTVSGATERILAELQRMGVDRDAVILSTNLRVRLDGLPLSKQRAPEDPGAAVYWQRRPGEAMRCMAIDRYTTIAGNLAALAATLEAMRAIERHGGAEILDRTFSGFKQLAAENEGPSWWGVLQVRAGATVAEIEAAYRNLSKIAHPDLPTGSHDAMASLNAAREEGLSVAKHGSDAT